MSQARARKDPTGDRVQQTGFLGTAAPWTADLTLVLELALGTGLLAGRSLRVLDTIGSTPPASRSSCYSI